MKTNEIENLVKLLIESTKIENVSLLAKLIDLNEFPINLIIDQQQQISLFEYCIQNEREDAIELLTSKYKIDVNVVNPVTKETPLLKSLKKNTNPSIIKTILFSKASVNVFSIDELENSTLHLASQHNSIILFILFILFIFIFIYFMNYLFIIWY